MSTIAPITAEGLVNQLRPISLVDLDEAAALQKRVDRK